MENQIQIGILIGVGCLVMLSLALIIITFLNIHRKKMLEKEQEKQMEIFKVASEVEEKQKEKIAKNIHDEIIPTLSAIGRSIDKNIKDFESNKFDIERIKKTGPQSNRSRGT
jgi:hypothetical protein